jgi:hypothetical protein
MTSEVIDTGSALSHDRFRARRNRPAKTTRANGKTMINATELADRYLAIWNETDSNRRRLLIDQTFTDDALYLDPLLRGDGHAGIDAMIGAAQSQFPGHVFRRVGEVDAHNGSMRFVWELVESDAAEPEMIGTDFAVIAPDGRLDSVTGFFDKVPAGVGG